MSGPTTAQGARRPRVDAVGLLLPATWWTIDLRGEDSRRRSVAQLVAEQSTTIANTVWVELGVRP